MSMADFWACSLWEFACAVDGWNRAHGGDDRPGPPSDAEFDAMMERFGFA